ncbi:hypothetical protein PV325_011622 [Microctonus aethiopoides]|nr:hypothetical protein PV325_011622 [Microctonus aethiopoides]
MEEKAHKSFGHVCVYLYETLGLFNRAISPLSTYHIDTEEIERKYIYGMKSRRQTTDSRGRSSRLKADWLARRYSTEHREVGHSNVAKEREQKITTLTRVF